jgi:hypothetical protein
MLRRFSAALMALAAVSCSVHTSDIVGCYDVQQDIPGTWPPVRFTDDSVDYQKQRWKRIVSLDTKHPLTSRSLWREDGDVVLVYFGPDDFSMTDNFGSNASLQLTERGFGGTMRTVTMAPMYSRIDFLRRPCESRK